MSQKTWLEKQLKQVRVLPQRWYLIFRALDEFTGLADVYGGGCRHFALWIVLVMQVFTDGEMSSSGGAETVLKEVKRLLDRRLEVGKWEEVESAE